MNTIKNNKKYHPNKIFKLLNDDIDEMTKKDMIFYYEKFNKV